LEGKLNGNITVAGKTAVTALEANNQLEANLQSQEKKLLTFLSEFKRKGSEFQKDTIEMKNSNNHLFEMIKSVSETALTSSDIKDVANLSNIDEINDKII